MQPSETTGDYTEADDEITGLPLLPSWGMVYRFVVVVFAVYVVLLSWLTKAYL